VVKIKFKLSGHKVENIYFKEILTYNFLCNSRKRSVPWKLIATLQLHRSVRFTYYIRCLKMIH